MDLAAAHEITSAISAVTDRTIPPEVPGPPEEFVESMDWFRTCSVIQHGLLCGELLTVLSALEPIPALVLKGPSISARYYPPGGRLSRDIDICVHASDYEHARSGLDGLGYVVMPGYDESIQRRQAKDVGFTRVDLDGKQWSVEIHWRFAEPGTTNLNEDTVWAAAQTVSIPGGTVRCPSPEHTLLLLSLNLRKHRFARLKTLCDIASLLDVEGETLNWSFLHAEAHRAEVCCLLRHSLHLATEYFSAPAARLPTCHRERSIQMTILTKLAQADAVLAEGRGSRSFEAISGVLPFVSLDNFRTSAHLISGRLSLSPEMASYRTGIAGRYQSRRQYLQDTVSRIARAAGSISTTVLSRDTPTAIEGSVPANYSAGHRPGPVAKPLSTSTLGRTFDDCRI